MSGTPPWWRSKCSPFGVMVPVSDCRGVNETPAPGASFPNGCPTKRLTGSSNFDGWPYVRIGAPSVVIQDGNCAPIDSVARVCAPAVLATPPAAMRSGDLYAARQKNASFDWPGWDCQCAIRKRQGADWRLA